MSKIRVGIKFKILMGVSFLLILCTAFNLGYSYKLFIEDKTSYIFENGLKKAENISEQINFKLNDLIVRTEFNSVLLNNPAIDFEKLINNQSEIVMVGTVDINNGLASIAKQYLNTKNISRINRTYGIGTNEFIKEVLDNASDPSILTKNKVWIFSPKPNQKFLFYMTKMPKNNNFLFSISDFSPLLEIFYKDRIFTNKIISLTSAKDRLENAELISKIDYNKSKKGAFETLLNHQSFLLSYAFVSEKMLVLSMINKEDAFGVTKYLILKTTLFAFFLIGVAMVIGIYFSSSITSPIIKLTNNAKKIASGDFSSYVQIRTSDEIQILGEAFKLMTSEIRNLLKNKEDLIAKLEDYSKNLEQMVEQRTLELKDAHDFMALMVNSLDQGLLVFDQNLQCHPVFTKACISIFGISPVDQSVPEVLSITDKISSESLKQWAMVVFNEMIPFESAVRLGPLQKITGKSYTDLDYKFVQLDYHPMRNENNKISNVVMIATDKTKEVQATEKAKEKEAYVSMILKILNNKTQFASFIHEVEGIFEQFNKAFSALDYKTELDRFMILFHTLNGGFGIYSMAKLQQEARECESEIINIKDKNAAPTEYIPLLKKRVKTLKQTFKSFVIELDTLIGTKFATSQSVKEIPCEKIFKLRGMLNPRNQIDNKELQSYYEDNFVKDKIINYFNAYDDLCKTAAKKNNKEFKGLIFHNADLRIEAEPLMEFFNVLVHLFRNCIDHGLENVNTREKNGKNKEGQIDVSFNEVIAPKVKLLSVVIQDDGAGIDPQVIRARYQKLNPHENVSNISDKKIIYKIFDPFFTTKDEVSTLSGRGVGMSAIKEVVDRLQGNIEIESRIGQGTIFSFLIPLP